MSLPGVAASLWALAIQNILRVDSTGVPDVTDVTEFTRRNKGFQSCLLRESAAPADQGSYDGFSPLCFVREW
jgi:hypothetical protein